MNTKTLDRYDFESRFVEVTGGRMHYIDVGSGPLLAERLHRRRNLFIRSFMPSWIHHRESRTPQIMHGYESPHPDYASRVAGLKMPREIPMTPLHHNFWLLQRLSRKLKGWEVPSLIVWHSSTQHSRRVLPSVLPIISPVTHP